jgi:Protein of unknown function (DUF3489)
MRDARSLSNDALETLRWRAVTIYTQGRDSDVDGDGPQSPQEHGRPVAKKWWREGGDAALKLKRRDRTGRKQAQMIEMLKHPEGATVEQIAEATGLAAPE